jgi:glycosyltransferase involved in cell wall biosynthesis
MKILVVAGFAESVVRFRGELLRSAQRLGATIHVAAPHLTADSAEALEMKALGFATYDIPLRRTGTNPLNDAAACIALARMMTRLRPDLVLCYTVKPVIYGSIAAWMCGVPRRYALITGLGHAFQASAHEGLQRIVRTLYGFALRKVHKVFFQNPDDQALFRQQRLLPATVPSSVVNGSGVDTAHYAPVPVPTGPPRFLLIARLLGEKGIREYVGAARRILAQHPQVSFSLAGWLDSNPSSITREELDEWINEGVVHFLGRLDDVRPAIASCTVYVLPSYREGTPRTVLEAMSMGRAVVTTDAPGCRETVRHGDNGFLVQPGSVDSLEAALLRFVADIRLATEMGSRSRTIAQDKYDVHAVNAQMLREMGLS